MSQRVSQMSPRTSRSKHVDEHVNNSTWHLQQKETHHLAELNRRLSHLVSNAYSELQQTVLSRGRSTQYKLTSKTHAHPSAAVLSSWGHPKPRHSGLLDRLRSGVRLWVDMGHQMALSDLRLGELSRGVRYGRAVTQVLWSWAELFKW